ncbi:hypothetical protein HaLaN_08050, partial [Haematococcus lacustris]
CGTLASKSPTASKCPSSQTEEDSLVAILLADSQPGAGLPPATSWPRTSISPLPASLPSARTMATVPAVQERVLSLSSGQRPSPSRRAVATPHRLSYTGSRLHPFPVLPRLPSLPHMLAHIMARQQPERLPPGSGAALLAEPPSADHLQNWAPNWAGAAGFSQRSMGQHLLEGVGQPLPLPCGQLVSSELLPQTQLLVLPSSHLDAVPLRRYHDIHSKWGGCTITKGCGWRSWLCTPLSKPGHLGTEAIERASPYWALPPAHLRHGWPAPVSAGLLAAAPVGAGSLGPPGPHQAGQVAVPH